MISRETEKILIKLAKGYPVITITGPRQSGKTTLAKYIFHAKPYVSLENPDTREIAENDPRGFLHQYQNGAILDEVQRTPHLLSYLQQIVDEKKTPGHYILTGSQQFGLLSGITQSLAGRTAQVTLLPFSLNECYGDSITNLSLDRVMFTGLYPPVHDRKLDPGIWYANYVQTYIERDIRQLINVRDLSTFQRFIRLCAARTGMLLNLTGLASDCGITHNTAKAWISMLEASFIVYLLQPHFSNFNKRLIKTPKLYFYDTGLACWLLGIQNAEQLSTHSMRGPFFESFIISEFIKSRYNRSLTSNCYFWRDRRGLEIDLLLEKGEQLLPVELKSGMTLNDDYFSGLNSWLNLAGNAAGKASLIYGGSKSLAIRGVSVYTWKDKNFTKVGI
ncbi:MAG TPA: ATP-binding protein [Spirochaetota bacterium]|nr:ATP-binding protein [Spirochaetota bacterium]HPI90100.1 ATP-binding protein [Spirochaetota bacterium]HPR49540.1 ATP-binding protein [Spirochaetota bacterium]